MGSSQSIKYINFEDMQYAINNKYVIINTLPIDNQYCLIKNTLNIQDEIILFNNKNIKKNINIVIYGNNSTDELIFNKYNQLYNMGYYNIYIYTGGIFEWLLLQDIYGQDTFPTTSKELDILKYKGSTKLNILMLKN